MDVIAKQPYIKMIRKVSSVKQIDIEHERYIQLFPDKIMTEHREFLLPDVFDLSFRKIGEEGGILFIHTNHSVYSYTVKSSPEAFIQTCKMYIGNY